MDRVTRGSGFLLSESPLLEFQIQPIMHSIINWCSSFLHSLQHAMDPMINWLVSLISCLATKINPILEKFTGHQFNVKTESCDEISMGGNWLLYVAICLVVALAAIPVVWLLWKLIFTVISWIWKLISTVISWIWKLIKGIFCCGRQRGKTMKAPGRNIRIYRNDFETSPKNYFSNLRRDQRTRILV